MRTLWCDETSEHHGRFYDLRPSRMYPKPVQSPHPPIHVGGESDAALRRVARVGQGWYTFNRPAEDLAAPLARLDELLAAAGRSRADIELSACPYFEPCHAGADRRLPSKPASTGSSPSATRFDRDMLLKTLDDLAATLL